MQTSKSNSHSFKFSHQRGPLYDFTNAYEAAKLIYQYNLEKLPSLFNDMFHEINVVSKPSTTQSTYETF